MRKLQLFKDIRINSGKYRGVVLYRADVTITRPALNRSRTAIFNILNSRFNNNFETVLDCFAGSGAIAIEAISREIAKKAVMCDISTTAIFALNKNIEALDNYDKKNCTVIKGDITKIIKNYIYADLIFIDPPYKDTEKTASILISNISQFNFKAGTVIIVETDSKNPVNIVPLSNIKLFDHRKYGRNEFLFFIKK